MIQSNKRNNQSKISDGRPNQNMIFAAIIRIERVDRYKDIFLKNDNFLYIITIIGDNKMKV